MIGWFAHPDDRAFQAAEVRKRMAQPGWISNVITQARVAAGVLHDAVDERLTLQTRQLRRHVQGCQDPLDESSLMIAAAAVLEAIRQTTGLHLFDVQLHAGLVIASGGIAEMQTGEGKTLSAMLPAYVHALPGRGVHVATPNEYLATRDHEKLSPAFAKLGMTAGLIRESSTREEKHAAYRCDVTYGAAHAFGFDYLRDQIAIGDRGMSGLGGQVYASLSGMTSHTSRLQRGLAAAIVDEIDHVLIDDAVSPLLLSGKADDPSPDADVHLAAAQVAGKMIRGHEFELAPNRQVELTQAGFNHVYDASLPTIRPYMTHPTLVRPWHEYVTLALRASHQYQRDIDYVVQDQCVRIVDASTGRIFDDRTWSGGLQQAIQNRENVEVTDESKPTASITRQQFYRQYGFLAGMTGTAADCQTEFESVYGLPVCVVPLRTFSKRNTLPAKAFKTIEQKYEAIAAESQAVTESGRAVLIGTLNIRESLAIAAALDSYGLTYQLLNGVQDSGEADLIKSAGSPGAITVATNLAGRGTDIALHEAVRAAGGLHVIVSQKHLLARVDRQLIGRCGRCGDPGSARVYVSAEDIIVADHAPWIQKAMERYLPSDRFVSDLEGRLDRVQRQHQRQETSRRRTLLQRDRDQDRAMSRSTCKPEGCFQL